MQDAALMSMLNCMRELCGYFRRVAPRHWLMIDYLIKSFAINQVHAEIARAARFSYFVNWNNTGMIQASGGFGLEAKPLDVCFRSPPAKTDDLQCYYAVETFLPRLVNHGLTTAANFLQQLVVP